VFVWIQRKVPRLFKERYRRGVDILAENRELKRRKSPRSRMMQKKKKGKKYHFRIDCEGS
jgi:hypothetical protein